MTNRKKQFKGTRSAVYALTPRTGSAGFCVKEIAKIILRYINLPPLSPHLVLVCNEDVLEERL